MQRLQKGDVVLISGPFKEGADESIRDYDGMCGIVLHNDAYVEVYIPPIRNSCLFIEHELTRMVPA